MDGRSARRAVRTACLLLVSTAVAAGAAHVASGSDPHSFHRIGDRVVFVADDGEHGHEPWVTDGTAAGTRRLADLCPGPCGILKSSWAGSTGARLFFVGQWSDPARGEFRGVLWTTDGTPSGTRIVLETGAEIALLERFPGRGVVAERGLFFFAAYPHSENRALWVTDGTRAGTRRLPGFEPSMGVEIGGRLVFAASDAELTERELWTSDGTPAGTGFLEPREVTGSLGIFTRLADVVLLFRGTPGGLELWRSDGTSTGTARIGFPPGSAPPRQVILGPAPLGEVAVFAVEEADGSRTLWHSDGTSAGTTRISTVPPYTWSPGASLAAFLPFGDRLFYLADDGVHGLEPWVTDGTAAGTRMLADLCPGRCPSSFGLVLADGDRVTFALDRADEPHQHEIWETDGTRAGTRPLALPTGDGFLLGWVPLAHGGIVYFVDHYPGGGEDMELWASEGPGTERWISDFPRWGLRPRGLGHTDGWMVFEADDGFTGAEPWVSDGTAAGTHLLADLKPGGAAEPEREWLASPELPDFRFKVRITPPGGEPIAGAAEPDCLPETACVSGAVAGRPEVFLRVVGPKANGYLWPTLAKFTTSTVEVWIEQLSTGNRHVYVLPGARPGLDVLPGLFDREGFLPPHPPAAASALAAAWRGALLPSGDPARQRPIARPAPRPASAATTPPPPGTAWLTDPSLPGFRFQVRVTNQAGAVQTTRLEERCIAETACVSGAVAGRSELFLRMVGPKPNGRLWPTLVRFSTSTVEVWIEQEATGELRHYLLPGADPDGGELDGLFDRWGFAQ